ncbi:MAG: folylpolyglutamate synthase/dihydrofolate synthase family protein [Candidatus Coatesbacteria bacterium]
MTYANAVAFLERLADYERLTGYRYDTKTFGPDRMKALLERIGRPQDGYPCLVVVGTKGKGSTAAMLASILDVAAPPVGLYTSPHLASWTERIRIGGADVTEEEFAALAAAVAGPVAALEAEGSDRVPTTFEVLTAMALVGFARRGVKAAVLEAGMGGRLDAVNAVDAAGVVFTSVSLDHMDQLGSTVEAIAAEKAGVIRVPQPVTCAPQAPGVQAVIDAACREAGAPPTLVGREVAEASPARCDVSGCRFDARTPRGIIRDLAVPLVGRHQVVNALVAVGAAMNVPLAVSDDSIRQGLASVRWPGRLQLLRPGLLVDGAHNGASAEALAAAIREFWGSRPRRGLIFAQLKGKDHAAVARALVPLANRIWCPALAHARAVAPAELVAIVREAGGQAETCGDVAGALAAARRDFGEDGDLVLVSGSLALVGEVMLACSAAWRP